MNRFFALSWTIIKKSFINFLSDDFLAYASSIAFYTIFSMPAILIMALAVGSAFYEQEVVQREMINQTAVLMGASSANEIDKILTNTTLDATSTFAKVFGVATLVFSATTVFISLQWSLNKIWGIKPKPARGIVKFLLNRLLSLAMVGSIGFILLVSLVIDAALVIFQNSLSQVMEGVTLVILDFLNLVFSLGFITIVFGLLFKVLPDARIRWKDVWVGAIVTTGLFTAGKYLIGFYLGNSSFNSAYGAAGSLVVLLVWVYYSTVILLFGAELTSVYAKETGSEIKPYDIAVKVEIVELQKDDNNNTTAVTSKGHQ